MLNVANKRRFVESPNRLPSLRYGQAKEARFARCFQIAVNDG
jgi:hypothetical protein